MLKLLKRMAVLAGLVLAPVVAHAEAPASVAPAFDATRFAAGGSIGSQGGTVLGEYLLNDKITLRAQGSFLDFDTTFKSSSLKYKAKLNQDVGGGYLDFHPASNPFFVSVGFDGGQRKATVHATANQTVVIKINHVPYTASQIGAVDGTIRFSDASPVLSLGYDSTFHSRSRLGFRVLAGVLFSDDPKVTLVASGPFANDPTVQSNLIAEQASLRKDAGDFKYYPVVSVGLTYRF